MNESTNQYHVINLAELFDALHEQKASEIISSYSCPENSKVEKFLKQTARNFDLQSISKTHLVFMKDKSKSFVGYFTLAMKVPTIYGSGLSCRKKRLFKRFGTYNRDLDLFTVAVPLIAQLGKNYTNGNNLLIQGDTLLQLALDMISDIQFSIGGKVVYIECEGSEKLTRFYSRNGFEPFGIREDKQENLIQMMKVL